MLIALWKSADPNLNKFISWGSCKPSGAHKKCAMKIESNKKDKNDRHFIQIYQVK